MASLTTFSLSAPKKIRSPLAAPVRVVEQVYLGGTRVVTVQLGAHALRVKTPPEQQDPPGSERFLVFPESHSHVYSDGKLIG